MVSFYSLNAEYIIGPFIFKTKDRYKYFGREVDSRRLLIVKPSLKGAKCLLTELPKYVDR